MKCNQSRPGFELVSPCPFPTTISITPRVPPFICLYASFTNLQEEFSFVILENPVLLVLLGSFPVSFKSLLFLPVVFSVFYAVVFFFFSLVFLFHFAFVYFSSLSPFTCFYSLFICPSSHIFHADCVSRFKFLKGISILPRTIFAPAKLDCSVYWCLLGYFLIHFSFSISTLTFFRS